MLTIQKTIYRINELPEKIQRKILDNYEPHTEYIYDDAYQTVKAFHKIFDTSEGRHSWLDVRLNYDDAVLELTGVRLMRYLWNNYESVIFKPAYKGCIDKGLKHKRTKVKQGKSGEYSFYYSGYKKEYSCNLTGVCYDMNLLDPIYKAMLTPYAGTFEELINECFESLRKSVENEVESRHSDECKIEDLQENYYDINGRQE